VEPAKSRAQMMRVRIHALVNDVAALHLHLQVLVSDAGLKAPPDEIRILQKLGESILAQARDLAGQPAESSTST